MADRPRWVLVVRLDPRGRVAAAVGVEPFEALIALARERLATVAGRPLVPRRYGDDLVVRVRESTIADAVSVAHRCLTALDEPWSVGGRRVPVRALIGVAPTGRDPGEDPQSIADARAAIVMVSSGPGPDGRRIAVADAILRRSLRRDMDLEAGVEVALERDELDLEFQPIVSLASGQAEGAEALLRWRGAPEGNRDAADFLAAARRGGAMPAVTDWVLDHAIAAAASWPLSTFVSINLDPADLVGPDAASLPGRLADSCRRHGVTPDRVWLEVTEHAVDELSAARGVLGRLASLGARTALDDLGSGCASLSRLHELPFEVCKLDRSLIRVAARQPPVADLLRAVVAHAHGSAMTVVAEGVETPAERRVVAEAGCELAQGFHLYRPLTADVVGALFSAAGEVCPAVDADARLLPGA